MKHGEVYTCKRLRLLNYLTDKGFYPFEIVPDINNPKYKTWKFKNSPELERCLKEYFNKFTVNKV